MSPRVQELHITIGSTPATFPGAKRGIDLTSDVEMVKAAVLYADKATLCSPAYSALCMELISQVFQLLNVLTSLKRLRCGFQMKLHW